MLTLLLLPSTRYFYVNGRYFHASNLANWNNMAKPVRGSTAKHKGDTQDWRGQQSGNLSPPLAP